MVTGSQSRDGWSRSSKATFELGTARGAPDVRHHSIASFFSFKCYLIFDFALLLRSGTHVQYLKPTQNFLYSSFKDLQRLMFKTPCFDFVLLIHWSTAWRNIYLWCGSVGIYLYSAHTSSALSTSTCQRHIAVCASTLQQPLTDI